MMRAAGAEVILPAHESFPWFSDVRDDDAFEKYVATLREAGVAPMKMCIFSAHQMSSCRMASSPSHGPVSPTGELWECKGLYVADASIFPTSLGLNPMITVAGMFKGQFCCNFVIIFHMIFVF